MADPWVMWPERLTPHFSLAELTRSSVAATLGIENDPPPELIGNALRLCELAEFARDLLGQLAGVEVRIDVSSGYRCLTLNAAVGGSGGREGEKLSAHCDFRAIDFHVHGTNLPTAFEALAKSSLPFDKLILEIDTHGATWLHLQAPREGAAPARRVLRGMKGPSGSTYRDLT